MIHFKLRKTLQKLRRKVERMTMPSWLKQVEDVAEMLHSWYEMSAHTHGTSSPSPTKMRKYAELLFEAIKEAKKDLKINV